MKKKRKAIALIFKNRDAILIVKRSPSKRSYPSFWSLPSTYLKDGSIQDTARQLVRRKLGLNNVEISETPIGVSERERTDFFLEMSDYDVEKFSGGIALNPEEYTDMRWITPEALKQLLIKEHGSDMGQCCETFLRSKNLI